MSLETVSGGVLLADRIAATGAGTVFALAGAAHAPLLLALEERGIAIVGTRHENGSVGAADGYARASGRIGFALIIAEQGLPNAMSAIRTAQEAGSPVVVLTTRYPDRWIEAGAPFAVDHHEMVASTVKFRGTVPTIDRLGAYFDAACRAASEGRPGVAVLILPSSFMAGDVAPSAAPVHARAAPAHADPAAVAEAAALLCEAKRPIVIAESAAADAEAGPGLRRLAALGLPILANGLARGLVPEVAPRAWPWPYAQLAAPQADVALVVGGAIDMRHGFGRPPRFAPDVRFIHVTERAEDVGRNAAAAVAMIGGLASSTLALADAIEARGATSDPAWLVDALAERDSFVSSIAHRNGGPIHPVEIGALVEARAPADRLVVGDGADILNFTYARLRVHGARAYADHAPVGSMGMGMALAIGMAAAERERAGAGARPTILVTGDGSIGFLLAELDTIRRAGLRLIVLVGNDGMWGTEYHGQLLAYGRAVNTRLDGCDYARVAEGLGMPGRRVATREDLGAALDEALALDGPMLIDVVTDPDAGRGRKTDPRLAMVIFDDIPRKA